MMHRHAIAAARQCFDDDEGIPDRRRTACLALHFKFNQCFIHIVTVMRRSQCCMSPAVSGWMSPSRTVVVVVAQARSTQIN